MEIKFFFYYSKYIKTLNYGKRKHNLHIMITFMEIIGIHVGNIVVIDIVSINIINRITDVAFMCYKCMFLKDVC